MYDINLQEIWSQISAAIWLFAFYSLIDNKKSKKLTSVQEWTQQTNNTISQSTDNRRHVMAHIWMKKNLFFKSNTVSLFTCMP